MKKVYSALTLILSSFFLFFISDVKALDISIEITDSQLSSLSNFEDMKSLADNFGSSDYIIFYYDGYYYVCFLNNSSYVRKTDMYFGNQRVYVYQLLFNSSYKYLRMYSDDFTSLVSPVNNWSSCITFSPNSFFIYSTFNIPFDTTNNDNIIFSYNEEFNYSFVNDGSNTFPSLYDISLLMNYNVEPVSVDNTPILTSFYSLINSHK